MATVPIWTYKDALDHALDFLGSNATGDARRDALRAVQTAYRELSSLRRWYYYYQVGRITTVAKQNSSTIAYTQTGGAYERMATIAAGTWPSWAASGVLVIGTVAYQVASRQSSTVITLSVNSNPGADVAAGTSYTLFQDAYTLPADCLAIDQIRSVGTSIAVPQFVHPNEWLVPQQFQVIPSTPRRYTVMGSNKYFGALVVRFHPAPDAAYTFDFIYHRRPRPLLIDEYSTGTVSVGAGNNTVTGVGTAWASKHIGTVIRLSADSLALPTGLAGLNAFAVERVVTAVASATSLTVDTAIADAYTGVKYNLSDPVDIEEGAMLNALQRAIEKQIAISRNMKTKGDYLTLYSQAVMMAMEADSRVFQERRAGPQPTGWPIPLEWHPQGGDS